MYFPYSDIIYLWKRLWPSFHLNKLELFPLKEDDVCIFEIGPQVLKKILKYHQCILAILLLSPIGKGMFLNLKKLESPSTKDACFTMFYNFFRFVNKGYDPQSEVQNCTEQELRKSSTCCQVGCYQESRVFAIQSSYNCRT